jgi:hypothetical protein
MAFRHIQLDVVVVSGLCADASGRRKLSQFLACGGRSPEQIGTLVEDDGMEESEPRR